MAEGGGVRVGRTIGGRYRIVSRLGAGGMATVYLANDARVARQVVLKVPHPELLTQRGFRERFQREIRSLIELQHPGIVPLYDCGEEPGGLPWCAVRYLDGGDLADRMERAGGRLSAAEISRWLPRVAETLDFVHARGVLHRDLSPPNILFDAAGNVFLSDFGVAAMTTAADETASDARLTAEGSFVGSAVYSPPEAVYRQLTPAYDQYSLALVLYHALTGFLPYPQVEARSLMLAKNGEPPAPVDRRGVPVPAAAAAAVMRGLAREPAERFPSCSALAEAFCAGEAAGPVTERLELPSAPAGRRRARAGLRAFAAAALVALAAAGVWRLGLPQRDPASRGPTAGGEAPAPTEEVPVSRRVLGGRFRAGSTPEEIASALRVCTRHAMDCPPSLYADERLRDVQLAPFTLDRSEVRNRDFAAFVDETGWVTTAERRGSSRDGPFEERGLDWRHPAGPRSSWENLPDHPVVHVSAADAEAYCAHRGGRLPTEDEWELAARGPERRVYPWGDRWDPTQAGWASGPETRLHPIGDFPPGPFGHVDLAGNVWEWTATHQGDERVLKGGSWMETNPADLRAAVRLVADPADRSSDIGFRCARDAAE